MRLVLLALVIAGCAAPAAPPAPRPAPPAAAGPLAAIAWFPAGSRHIARQLPGAITALDWFASISNARHHACWAELEAGVARAYTVRRRGADPAPVLVLHGRLPRGPIEACVEAELGITSHAPLRLRLDDDGEVTRVVTRLGDAYVGWLDEEWIVISSKRSRVHDFLDRDSALGDDGAMTALLAWVDDAAPLWAVVGDGYVDPLIGVPTRGAVLSGSLAPARVTKSSLHGAPDSSVAGPAPASFKLTIACASADAARVAIEAIAAGRLRAEVPEALHAAMGRLALRADGADLHGQVELTADELAAARALIARSR